MSGREITISIFMRKTSVSAGVVYLKVFGLSGWCQKDDSDVIVDVAESQKDIFLDPKRG